MEQKETRLQPLQLIGILVFVLVTVGATVAGYRWVMSLKNPDTLAAFQEAVADMGAGGWFVLLGIQFVQIVLAFIPGGPIQVVAGALYGPWGGLAICVTGIVLATAAVFGLVHRYGRRIIHLFLDEKDILRYQFLHDSKKLELLVLLLFFIPGTPKDALTYLFALTDLPMRRFLLLSTAARLPGILTSVLAGDSIIQGEWLKSAILFGALALIAVVGFFVHRKVAARRTGRD